MEIISYGSAVYSPKSKVNVKMPSFKEVSVSAKSAVLKAVHFLRASVKFLWLVPAAAAVALMPVCVTKLMDMAEAHARPVAFEENTDAQIDYVAGIMCDFAMNGDVAFDAEGNLISLEGVEAAAPAVYFKDPVTFQKYTVKSGDTISGISQKFGLKNISTLIAVNGIGNVRELKSGEKLVIPSMDGMYHKVSAGETITSISAKYGVSIEDLLDVNDLSSDVVAVNSNLFIPGAKMDSYSLKKAMGEVFAWPLTSGVYRITSRFGYRKDPITGVDSTHKGIDLACPTGTPIKAAMSGTVTIAGWSNLYGYYVVINHIDGYQTLYGHMSKILCKKGDKVSQGTKIGLVGSTGYSTGPHLHFTVYKNSKLVDPLTVLK